MFVSAAAAGQVLSFAFHVFAHDNRMKIKDCDLLLSAVFGKPSGGQEQAAFTRCKNAIYEVKQNKTQNENRKKKERKKCGRWFGELLGRNLVRAPRASRTRRAGGGEEGFWPLGAPRNAGVSGDATVLAEPSPRTHTRARARRLVVLTRPRLTARTPTNHIRHSFARRRTHARPPVGACARPRAGSDS